MSWPPCETRRRTRSMCNSGSPSETYTKTVWYPASFARSTIPIAPWPESVVSSTKLTRSASNALDRDIASRAAGIAARTGWAPSRRRAIASASIKLALPSNQIEDVNVDLPDPFGPAITVNVGTLFCERRDFAEYPEMTFSGGSGLQADLKPGSVRQFLNVPASVVHKDDRKPGSERIPACAKTSSCRCLGEVLGQNIGDCHQPQYRAVASRLQATSFDPDQSRRIDLPSSTGRDFAAAHKCKRAYTASAGQCLFHRFDNLGFLFQQGIYHFTGRDAVSGLHAPTGMRGYSAFR